MSPFQVLFFADFFARTIGNKFFPFAINPVCPIEHRRCLTTALSYASSFSRFPPPKYHPAHLRGLYGEHFPPAPQTQNTHGAVKQGRSRGSVGTTSQGKGRVNGEVRAGQAFRARAQGGERPMGTAAYGGKGFEGRAAESGERRIGAESCRQQHNLVSCHPPPPPAFSDTSEYQGTRKHRPRSSGHGRSDRMPKHGPTRVSEERRPRKGPGGRPYGPQCHAARALPPKRLCPGILRTAGGSHLVIGNPRALCHICHIGRGGGGHPRVSSSRARRRLRRRRGRDARGQTWAEGRLSRSRLPNFTVCGPKSQTGADMKYQPAH